MRPVLVIALFVSFHFINAQSFTDLSNPQASIKTFLSNLQDDNFNDSSAALPFKGVARDLEDAKKYAVKFKRVLDGKGIFIYLDEIPNGKNYYDEQNGEKNLSEKNG